MRSKRREDLRIQSKRKSENKGNFSRRLRIESKFQHREGQYITRGECSDEMDRSSLSSDE